jgi:rhodanese-related sulfurtransferase
MEAGARHRRRLAVAAVLLAVAAVLALLLSRAGRLSPEEAARELARGAALLDVRTAREFAGMRVHGAVNIPIQELRGRMDELPTERPLLVMCEHGPRSLMAAALLRARNINARPVAGGPGDWPEPLVEPPSTSRSARAG